MQNRDDLDFSPPDGAHVVTDPEQVALLTGEASKRFFKPFLGRERSAKEAADELGCSIGTITYRIRRFMDADLLRIVRTEPRRGRAVKYYRSTADAYFVSFAVTSFADLEERFRAQLEPTLDLLSRGLARSVRADPRQGEYLYRSPESPERVWTVHTTRTDPAEPDDRRAATFRDARLRLSAERVEQLLDRIEELFGTARGMDEPGAGPRHVFAIALAPEAE